MEVLLNASANPLLRRGQGGPRHAKLTAKEARDVEAPLAGVRFRFTHPKDLPRLHRYRVDDRLFVRLVAVKIADVEVDVVASWPVNSPRLVSLVGCGRRQDLRQILFDIKIGEGVELGREAGVQRVSSDGEKKARKAVVYRVGIGDLADGGPRPNFGPANSDSIDRVHCRLAWDTGWLRVVDGGSQQGTFVDVDAGYERSLELEGQLRGYEPFGTVFSNASLVRENWSITRFVQRQLLGRGEPLTGTVTRDSGLIGLTYTEGSWDSVEQRIALEWSPLLESCYGEVMDRIQPRRRSDRPMSELQKLRVVQQYVTDLFTHDSKRVAEMIDERLDDGVAGFTISEWIEAGVGLCHHQALVAGMIIERMIEVGELRGQLSFNRHREFTSSAAPLGHAFIRYEGEERSPAGESPTDGVIIVDPALRRCDYLDVLRESSKDWPYDMPGAVVFLGPGSSLLQAGTVGAFPGLTR